MSMRCRAVAGVWHLFPSCVLGFVSRAALACFVPYAGIVADVWQVKGVGF